MSSEDSYQEPFLTEFIDDLYAECDERLELVRRDLLSLEAFVQQAALDHTLLDALLRNLHTLKGLAGTINLKAAEQLAHQMENYLRAMRQGQFQLSVEGMETLVTGAQLLEQNVIAHRTQGPLPDITAVVTALTQLVSGTPVTLLATTTIAESSSLADEQAKITRIWRFEFIPSPTLAEQGINVNHIRSRLEEIGKITQAIPKPTKQGLSFEFLVTTSEEETHFAQWQLEGLTYTLHETQPEPKPAEEPIINNKPTSPAAVAHLPALAPTNMVRVDMARLDELMRLIGELVTTRARQENYLKQLRSSLPSAQWRTLQETNLSLERHLRALREAVMRVRLVSIGTAFERMQFVIRDLLKETSKAVQLELSGKETEIDKLMVDKIIDPLLHLVRNAISHGIEPAEERIAQGKPAKGTIALRAYTDGDMMTIEVEDDGAGIDIAQVTQQARAQGLIGTETQLETRQLLDILCRPSFTTQSQANLASGRGVGMDVVKSALNELGGFLSLDTQAGIGSRFTIQIPLTLAIADALIISVGGQRFAVPRAAIREVTQFDPANITVLEQGEILSHPNGVIPLVRLAHLFKLPAQRHNRMPYILIVGGSSMVGIVIDKIIGEQEIVVRSLTDPLVKVPGIVGASELGDGQIVLILDIAALIRTRNATLH